MSKEEFEKFGDDFIFGLEGNSDGFQTGYPYSEVKKAIKEAYNRALMDAARQYLRGSSIEALKQ